ncbi:MULTISPECIES: hypothetical protein [Kordiimonas]|uniref:hypothetical protein n=1 Tax=Kordiimonas TaxID=288021 RepID=UPI002580D0DF|nr:hypothetical protein [Kordiimonas sp. UBA4487]
MSKSETIGWMLSASLHLGVVTVALVGLPDWSKDRPTPPPPIAIEFVKIDDKTQVAAPEPEEQTQEQTVTEKPQPNYAREEVVADAPAEAVPLPDAKPERKVTEAKPKPAPKPEISERDRLIARTSPQSKPKPPSRLKSNRIAALIDRSIKEEQEQAPKDEEKKEEKVEQKKEEAKPDPFAGLRGKIATATLKDALQQKLSGCWNFPGGAKGVENMQVLVRIWIGSEGNLMRRPEFLNAGDLNDPDRAYFRVFAESARRAVQLCAPYPEATEYMRTGNLEYIDFNFNGADFVGG